MRCDLYMTRIMSWIEEYKRLITQVEAKASFDSIPLGTAFALVMSVKSKEYKKVISDYLSLSDNPEIEEYAAKIINPKVSKDSKIKSSTQEEKKSELSNTLSDKVQLDYELITDKTEIDNA